LEDCNTYHKTKDPYYVENFLGHKSLRNTEICITIKQTRFEPTSDEFTVKVSSKPREIKTLFKISSECVCKKDDPVLLSACTP